MWQWVKCQYSINSSYSKPINSFQSIFIAIDSPQKFYEWQNIILKHFPKFGNPEESF